MHDVVFVYIYAFSRFGRNKSALCVAGVKLGRDQKSLWNINVVQWSRCTDPLSVLLSYDIHEEVHTLFPHSHRQSAVVQILLPDFTATLPKSTICRSHLCRRSTFLTVKKTCTYIYQKIKSHLAFILGQQEKIRIVVYGTVSSPFPFFFFSKKSSK